MGTPDPPDPKPETPIDPVKGDGKRFTRRQLTVIWAGVAAAVPVIAVVPDTVEKSGKLAEKLWDVVDPEPTPTPTPSPTPTPPPIREGSLLFAKVGARNVTLYDTAVHSNRDRELDNYPPERFSWRGLIIDYRVEFKGMVQELCTVHWTLLDEENERVSDPDWKTVDAAAWPNEGWVPESVQSDVIEGDVWVPYLSEGTFRIVLTLKDSREYQLAELTTDLFSVPERGG